MKLEIIARNLKEAVLIEKLGADRIELIDSFLLGGLTPDLKLAQKVCQNLTIPVMLMLRPQGENFCYSTNDIIKIKKDLEYIITHIKAQGIVFGAMTPELSVNHKLLTEVLTLIENTNLELTFHRAIDVSRDIIAETKSLAKNYKNTKLTRVLSSGGKPNAILGLDNLIIMQQLLAESGISLLPGAGLDGNNLAILKAKLFPQEVHLGTGVRIHGKIDPAKFKAVKELVIG